MPWPMIHFAIANSYHLNETNPTYLLGTIAPDAVLVRENDKEGKVKSHLGKNPKISDYLEFLRKNVDISDYSKEQFDFFLGYIAHVHVDLQWGNFKNDIAYHDGTLRDQLWQEENQMDFHIYRTEPWVDQLVKDIMRSPLYEVQGIYDKGELNLWRNNIFKWLDQPENEPKIMNRYITCTRVKLFIEQMTEELKGLDKALLQQLKDGRNIS